jgi:hypothetical protein
VEDQTDLAFDRLTVALESEHEALERLRFRLVSLRLFIMLADVDHVDLAVDDLNTEIDRTTKLAGTVSQCAAAVAAILGLPGGSSLEVVAKDSPEPYGGYLCELSTHVRTAGKAVEEARAQVSAATRSSLEEVNDLVDLTGVIDTRDEQSQPERSILFEGRL